MKKIIILLLFTFACCGMQEKDREHFIPPTSSNVSPLTTNKKKDSCESLAPYYYKLKFDESYTNLMVDRSKMTQKELPKRNSDFYIKVLKIIDGEEGASDNIQEMHDEKYKVLLGFFRELQTLYGIKARELGKELDTKFYAENKQYELNYYKTFWFERALLIKQRIIELIQFGDSITMQDEAQARFWKLLIFYKADDISKRPISYLTNALKIGNLDAKEELGNIAKLQEILAQRIENMIDKERYEFCLVEAEKNEKLAQTHHRELFKMAKQQETQVPKNKKRKKAFYEDLKKFTQRTINETKSKISPLNTPEETRKIQDEINMYKEWLKNAKKDYKKISEKKYKIEFSEKIDTAEKSHLSSALAFFDVFDLNPEKRYLTTIEKIMTRAATISPLRNPVKITTESCIIWKRIRDLIPVINNPQAALLSIHPEAILTNNKQE